MADRYPILPGGAPAPVAPYSPGMVCGSFLFVSGQLPLDAATGVLIEGDIRERTRQALRNMQAVVRAAGCELSCAVRVNIYLADMNDFAAVNEVYKTFFCKPYPARTAIQAAALPLGSDILIDGIFAL
ncbi:Rid family detoxifying hydrolase [Nitratidesulfovibrio vulgaris]|jgi:2-iminobutanoate/2-iminopropanoate deaminase|uniref:Endoribonuclease, L-PSP family n=2 Tax=Nitratidesulfovibrio vulgaris TaxID=881 RepID=Q72EF8_NITV2|nr:Rid family detoxifying hydrolase [Nitratidesulfovibrio vulgaris]GEB80000.1 reactive intermediate/imine deaminase [Desulfovibrio desulfuricans]HBW14558.1 reactive intermediate/imine deaminase [Desulfovibrio sp.]AAS95101.1 endoribonuclease, L-PSP family [Nitratidesulfovibrio vulgaris str. Hildenborough]ABM29353.1 putative endoribonuclease L-PSP [Nitratidesulfovibrio vulgaris DP4]ADP85735.1 endoribonuclease L-PSP [Nitratidesulfovibrio vulgaris RCH1]